MTLQELLKVYHGGFKAYTQDKDGNICRQLGNAMTFCDDITTKYYNEGYVNDEEAYKLIKAEMGAEVLDVRVYNLCWICVYLAERKLSK